MVSPSSLHLVSTKFPSIAPSIGSLIALSRSQLLSGSPKRTSSRDSPLRSLPVRFDRVFCLFIFFLPKFAVGTSSIQQVCWKSTIFHTIHHLLSPFPPSLHECSSESHPNRLTIRHPTTYMPPAGESSTANQRPVIFVFASEQVEFKRTLQAKQAGGCMPA